MHSRIVNKQPMAFLPGTVCRPSRSPGWWGSHCWWVPSCRGAVEQICVREGECCPSVLASSLLTQFPPESEWVISTSAPESCLILNPNSLLKADRMSELLSLISTIVTVGFSPVLLATTLMGPVHTFMCCAAPAIRNNRTKAWSGSQPAGHDPLDKPLPPKTLPYLSKGASAAPGQPGLNSEFQASQCHLAGKTLLQQTNKRETKHQSPILTAFV